MAEADLHVAVSLLRICVSYCKLVHLARTTPPSLSCESLKFFDEEVRRCFSTCIAADIPDDHWKQAQLSLGFGGLGFRSLSYHSCAAFISSLSSSGFGSASNHHLLSAISKFNALVSPTEAITVESVLSSPLSQHALCKKLDDHLFDVESYGSWGKEAQNTFARLASILSISLHCPKAKVLTEIYGRLNISLVRSVARAILSRRCSVPG